jgi:ribosomal protein L16 Arg81 hydroxylase
MSFDKFYFLTGEKYKNFSNQIGYNSHDMILKSLLKDIEFKDEHEEASVLAPQMKIAGLLSRVWGEESFAEFMKDNWGRESFYSKSNLHEFNGLTLDSVFEQLSKVDVLASNVTVINNSNQVVTSYYKRDEAFIDLPKVKSAFFNNEISVIFNKINLSLYPVQEYAFEFEKVFNVRSTINLYLTPPFQQTLERHWDCHEIFIIQIQGEKRWNLYDTPMSYPLANFHSYSDFHLDVADVQNEILASPGDLLYLPRGLLHNARAAKEHSMHLTISINIPTWYELVRYTTEALIIQSGSKLKFRRPIDLHLYKEDPDALRQSLKALLHEVLANLDNCPVSELLTDYIHGVFAGQPTYHVGLSNDEIDLNREYQNILIHGSTEIGQQEGVLVVHLHGSKLFLPTIYEDFLRQIKNCKTFRPSNMQGNLTIEELKKLIMFLLDKKLIIQQANMIGENSERK